MVESRRLALLEGITAGILFGSAALFIRLTGMNVSSLALWRLVIAWGAIASAILLLQRNFPTDLLRSNCKYFLVLGILLGVHFLLFISAVRNTTILNATVLVNTTPLFSMIISTFLYGVKPSKLALMGLTLSFIGASLLAFGDARKGNTASLIGDLQAALAAIVEGFYLNYGRKKRSQLPLLQTMFFIYLFSASTVSVALISFTPVLGEISFEIPRQLDALWPLLGLGVLSTAMAHTLFFSSLSHLKSFETATMALLESLGATFLGVLFFTEIPPPFFIFGAIIVLAGIFTVVSGR
ncbi:MAG: DMT family transporter [Candidatus Bathyarchaeota archaeon]|nr:MAG: DMT family transporter [Candidatus Bathyarchaeota archaeon]